MFGRARTPPLDGATEWLNSEPLGPAELRGHVVLVTAGREGASSGWAVGGQPRDQVVSAPTLQLDTVNSRSPGSVLAERLQAHVARHRLGAVGGAQLAEDVLDVRPDRALGDDQLVGDVGVARAARHQVNHLDLAPRE